MLSRTYLPPDNRAGEGNALSIANIIAVVVVVFVLSGALGKVFPGAARETPSPIQGMCAGPECGTPDLMPHVIVQTRYGRRDPAQWWRDPYAACAVVEYLDATNRVIFRNTHC